MDRGYGKCGNERDVIEGLVIDERAIGDVKLL